LGNFVENWPILGRENIFFFFFETRTSDENLKISKFANQVAPIFVLCNIWHIYKLFVQGIFDFCLFWGFMGPQSCAVGLFFGKYCEKVWKMAYHATLGSHKKQKRQKSPAQKVSKYAKYYIKQKLKQSD